MRELAATMTRSRCRRDRAACWLLISALALGTAACQSLGLSDPPEAEDQDAEAASDEPRVVYEAHLTGVEDEGLLEVLRASSQLVALADKPPATTVGLRRRAEDDVERLQTALRSEGYYDGQIALDIDTEMAPATVELAITPGTRYSVAAYNITYTGTVPEPAEASPTLEDIGVSLGMPARAPAVVAAEQSLIGQLQERGYPFATIGGRKTFIDRDSNEMTVELSVESGPKTSFGPLAFSGQKEVEESYLREIAEWPEGEIYDRRVVRDLQRRLGDTNLFSTVNAETAPETDAEGKVPVTVSLVEREHRSIGVAVAYSTDIGPSLEVFWEHRNLMGENEQLRLSATGSLIEQTGEIDFRKPAFLYPDQDLLANLTGGQEDTDAYERQSAEAYVGLERPVLENWTVSAGGSFAYEIVDEKADNGEGKRSFQLFGLPLTAERDDTNDPLDPTEGTRLQLSLTPTTGVGDESLLFLTAIAGGSAYYAIDEEERFVLAGRARLGTILGEDTEALPASRRFYAGGGGSIRGYEYQLVGPLDDDESPFGGTSLFEVGAEVRVRVTEEIGVVPFIDGGTVYDDPIPDGDETLRWAAGLGLRYFTGFGPIRLDVAFPLNPRDGVDETFQFYVSFGQAF